MKRLLFTLAILVAAGSAAHADPIDDRQALMKSVGRSVGTMAAMVKGEREFDAQQVLAALQTINESAQQLDVARLFPAGTDKGDTSAAPKIWEDTAGFQAAVDKFKQDAAAAVASAPQDLEGLKATLGTMGRNCSSCHESFRLKKG